MTETQLCKKARTPRVGAVVVTHGGGTLARCLAALDPQVHALLVVDNGSTDGSVAAAVRNQSVLYIRNEAGQGYAAAAAYGTNALLKECEYVFVCTHDTVVRDGCVAALVDAMEMAPRVGACAPRVVDPATGVDQHPGRAKVWFGHPYQDEDKYDYLCGCGIMLRASALQVAGTFDPSWGFYFEDVDLCWRIKDAGFELATVHWAVMEHARGSSLGPAKLRYLARNNLRFARERLPFWVLAVLALVTLPAKALWVASARRSPRGGAAVLAGVWDYLMGRRGLLAVLAFTLWACGCGTTPQTAPLSAAPPQAALAPPSPDPARALKAPYKASGREVGAPQPQVATPYLEWYPSPSPGVAWYRVYWGPTPGVYTNAVTVAGTNQEVQVAVLLPVFYAVTAVDTNGLESDFSEEVDYATLQGWPVHWKLPAGSFKGYQAQSTTDFRTWTTLAPPFAFDQPTACYRLRGAP